MKDGAPVGFFEGKYELAGKVILVFVFLEFVWKIIMIIRQRSEAKSSLCGSRVETEFLQQKLKLTTKLSPCTQTLTLIQTFQQNLPIICDKGISSEYLDESEENSNLSCGFLPDKVVINLPNRIDLRKTQQPST